MISKNCVCGQLLWDGDTYCVACGRPVNWNVKPKPSVEAAKILKSQNKEQNK